MTCNLWHEQLTLELTDSRLTHVARRLPNDSWAAQSAKTDAAFVEYASLLQQRTLLNVETKLCVPELSEPAAMCCSKRCKTSSAIGADRCLALGLLLSTDGDRYSK